MASTGLLESKPKHVETGRRLSQAALAVPFFIVTGMVGNGILLGALVLTTAVQPAALVLFAAVWALFGFALLRLQAIRRDHNAQALLALGFGLLLACAILLYHFGYPQLSIGQWPDNPSTIDYAGHDSLRYTVWSERVADIWQHGGSYVDAWMPLAQVGFPLFFAGLYRLLGVEPLFFVLVNTLMVGLAAICTYEIAWFWREQPPQRRDRSPQTAALLMLASPLVIVQGAAIPMKEAIVLFLVTAGVLAVEYLRRRFGLQAVLVLGLTTLALLDMRFYMVIVLALYAAYRLTLRYLNFLRLRNLVFLAAVAVAAALLGYRVLSGPLATVLQGDTSTYLGAFASYEQADSITAALYWRGSLALSFLIPIRAVVLLFNPIPPIYFPDYHVGSESANVLFVILLLPFALERVRQALVRNRPGALGYLLPLTLGLCVISALLPVSSPRFLIPVMPFYTVLAAQGIAYCRPRWRVTYFVWLAGLALGAGLLYTTLKFIL